jgi:hypothetical protein
LSRRRNPPFICAKKAGYAFGYNPPCARSPDAAQRHQRVHGSISQRRYGSRLCGAARRALHRVRDTSGICSRRRGDLPVGHFCVQPPLQKYFASPVGQIISTNSRHPTPQEGRIMIVTDAGWDAVDAAAFCARRDRRAGRKTCERSTASGREMLLRTAKSCGPDAPTLASSSRRLSRPYRAQTKP